MNDFIKLGLKYGTDKVTKHNYGDTYFELFKDRRNEVKKVLEIGVAEGAGLFMFRDFFPNAIIYGAEIDRKRVASLQGQERIEVFEVNQASEDDLINLINEIGGDIDLVIDDGSHKPEDQFLTAFHLMLLLDTNVTYVIEDVADLHLVDRLGNYGAKMVKVGKRYDDRLIILRHQ